MLRKAELPQNLEGKSVQMACERCGELNNLDTSECVTCGEDIQE